MNGGGNSITAAAMAVAYCCAGKEAPAIREEGNIIRQENTELGEKKEKKRKRGSAEPGGWCCWPVR